MVLRPVFDLLTLMPLITEHAKLDLPMLIPEEEDFRSQEPEKMEIFPVKVIEPKYVTLICFSYDSFESKCFKMYAKTVKFQLGHFIAHVMCVSWADL